jgi:hypothetical protein
MSGLQSALQTDSKAVNEFFGRYPKPSATNLSEVSSFIRNATHNQAVRRALRIYLDFAKRFSVYMRFEKQPPYFHIESDRLPGVKFYGIVMGGHIVPWTVANPEADVDPEFADFQNQDGAVPKGSGPLLSSGQMKWLKIVDQHGKSHLAEIIRIAYDPDAITFILYESRQPFLFSLIGENVTNKEWKEAAKIRTKFQQEHWLTATRGRQPNLQRHAMQYGALAKPGPMKNKAIDLAGVNSTQKQIDSMARALRRRKAPAKRKIQKP